MHDSWFTVIGLHVQAYFRVDYSMTFRIRMPMRMRQTAILVRASGEHCRGASSSVQCRILDLTTMIALHPF